MRHRSSSPGVSPKIAPTVSVQRAGVWEYRYKPVFNAQIVAEHRPAEIYCLGDTVGYGPNPRACLDLVRRTCAQALRGNHDHGVIDESYQKWFFSVAKEALQWTAREISRPGWDRKGYIETLTSRLVEGDAVYCHGSPLNPLDEYVYPHHTESRYSVMLDQIFGAFERVAFAGHTHVGGVFAATADGYTFTPANAITDPLTLNGSGQYLVNVGSVGQPRDGDPRSCYVIVEGNSVEFHRVRYDIRVTQERLKRAKVPEAVVGYLSDRLAVGE